MDRATERTGAEDQKAEVLAALDDLLRFAEARDDPAAREQLRGSIARVRGARCTIAIAADRNDRLAMFVDTLLSTETMPKAVDRVRSLPIHVEYGPRAECHVELRGRERTTTLEGLDDVVSETANPDNREQVRSITIACPADFLRQGFRLLLTPFELRSAATSHEAVLRYLRQGDCVVLVRGPDTAAHPLRHALRDVADRLFLVLATPPDDVADRLFLVLPTPLDDDVVAAPGLAHIDGVLPPGRVHTIRPGWHDERCSALLGSLESFARTGPLRRARAVARDDALTALHRERLVAAIERQALDLPLAELAARLDRLRRVAADGQRLSLELTERLDAYVATLLQRADQRVEELRSGGQTAGRSALEAAAHGRPAAPFTALPAIALAGMREATLVWLERLEREDLAEIDTEFARLDDEARELGRELATRCATLFELSGPAPREAAVHLRLMTQAAPLIDEQLTELESMPLKARSAHPGPLGHRIARRHLLQELQGALKWHVRGARFEIERLLRRRQRSVGAVVDDANALAAEALPQAIARAEAARRQGGDAAATLRAELTERSERIQALAERVAQWT